MSHPLLEAFHLSEDQLTQHITNALHGADDGELFVERNQSQSLTFDDGTMRATSFSESQGMGLRHVVGEFSGLVHSNQLSEYHIKKAAEDLKAIQHDRQNVSARISSTTMPQPLYTDANPVLTHPLDERVALLHAVDAYLRKNPYVVQATINVSYNHQQVMIVRPEAPILSDNRPLVRMSILCIVEKNGQRESGSSNFGGRYLDDLFHDPKTWQAEADEAIRQALVKVEAKPAPSGEMPVVLNAGWSGVLFHEAVGHGLEGDFNRKGTSAFTGMIGQQVAAKGVTVVDDGSIPNRRGSLTIDDEGTPTQRNVLIEDGILKGYMQDRLNARLMGVAPTGNGRRESYACLPCPRMTNTFLLGGDLAPEEIIANTKKGLYAKTFGGGQVDITSGNFVFEVSEAYLIENGKITTPVKGATLIGNGPKTLPFIDRIGNDMALDKGTGTCGKDGQSVPVGVGQPSLRVNGGITVGGTG